MAELMCTSKLRSNISIQISIQEAEYLTSLCDLLQWEVKSLHVLSRWPPRCLGQGSHEIDRCK